MLVVDLAASDPAADLATVRTELEAYDPALAARASLVVGTKADLVEQPPRSAAGLGAGAMVVSGTTGEGIPELRERLSSLTRRLATSEEEPRPTVVLRPARAPFVVTREGERRFRVTGRGVERWVAETDLDDAEAVTRLQRKLVTAGVERQLAAAGAVRGDEVLIGQHVFEFLPEDGGGDGPA